MEQAVPEGFSVFAFLVEHRRRLRTTNVLERLSQEIRRRTRVVNIFPKEASWLRLTSAILMEIDEERQTGRRYLSFEGSEVLKDT